ncbi:MAG: hypothetical protein GTO14_02660 [Anaerolineales bacterium]|nr:hypothetical protein [Anaerolineales bacterium]
MSFFRNEEEMTANIERKILIIILLIGALLLSCTVSDVIGGGPSSTPTGVEVAEGSSAIAGRVWHDLCAAPEEDQPVPEVVPSGCIEYQAPEGWRANGVLEGDEPGISGVEVFLGEGSCPAVRFRTSTTGADGFYFFAGLPAGTYCVSVDPSSGSNATLLLPGNWTYPILAETSGIASTVVTLGDNDVRSDVYFAWDYLFLPPYQPPAEPELTQLPAPTETPSIEPTSTQEITPSPEFTPTSTYTPTATLPPGDPRAGLGAPAFRDRFEDGSNWPLYEDEHSRFEIEENKLVMTAFNPDFWNGWMLTWPVIADFYLEVKGTIGACSGRDAYGVMVRAKETEFGHAGYLFGISCDGRYSLRIWDGERYTKLKDWTANENIIKGSEQTHRIGFLADGSTLKLYVNGKLVTQLTNPDYIIGLFGVFIGAAETANLTVHLEEVAYWNLP